MKSKFRDIVDTLDLSELTKIKDDLNKGGIHLKRLIEQQIKKSENMHEKYCSICSNMINPEDTNNFTLIFGPESFKKKATFCAIDCLQYFLKNIQDIRKHKVDADMR